MNVCIGGEEYTCIINMQKKDIVSLILTRKTLLFGRMQYVSRDNSQFQGHVNLLPNHSSHLTKMAACVLLNQALHSFPLSTILSLKIMRNQGIHLKLRLPDTQIVVFHSTSRDHIRPSYYGQFIVHRCSHSGASIIVRSSENASINQ